MKPRPLSLAQRRRLLRELPEIEEGPEVGNSAQVDPLWLFTGWSATQIVLQAGFEGFDRLPKPIRRALYEAVVTFDPRPVTDWVTRQLEQRRPRKQVVRFAVQSILAAEGADITDHATKYRRRYGHLLPHLAAKVSVMRYRSAENVGQKRGRAANKAAHAQAW
jgi:hypothetical protein